MDTKYAKYFLNHRLLLRDGFFTYYLQSRFLSADDIPDVQTLVFDWPGDTEQWLLQCADFDHFTTLNNLRDFLAEEEIPFGLHLMDDSRVLLAAVQRITNERVPIVIQPNHGWAVKTDPKTVATTIPIAVEAAPDADGLINELRLELNALVAEQKKKYDEYECRLAENNDFLEYSKAVGGGLYDFTESTVTSAIDAVKATYTVKETLNNLATSLKFAAARSLYYGTLDPLKNEINAIIKPVAATYEQTLEYRAIITTLFNDEETAELLTDFAKRYYEATHPLVLTRFGISGSGDIILTIILTIFTAGVGAAANTALKVKRLEKTASTLLKLAKILRRIGPRYRLPKLNKKAGIPAKKAAKSAIKNKKSIPNIESPKKKGDLVDGDGKKDYGDRADADGPKTTHKTKKSPKKKIDDLKSQGHGPQRHEGDVTTKQLEERCTKGVDPMTGNTTDGVTGKNHKYSRNATKVNTPEDYVKAEDHLKNSNEFKNKIEAADMSGKKQVVVKESKLKEIYGDNYSTKVDGRTRIGSAKNPKGSDVTKYTDESKMIGVYRKADDGAWKLLTMYPDP